jgi:hypothetical protein
MGLLNRATKIKLRLLPFFLHLHFHFSGNIPENFHRREEVSQRLDRLRRVNLPLVDLEALAFERIGNIASRYRAE